MKRTKQGRSADPAPTELPATSPLAGFVPLEEYQAPRAAILPSINSLRWIISENREEILEADALRQHRGRLMLHAERMDVLIDKFGKLAAERRFRGTADVMSDAEAA